MKESSNIRFAVRQLIFGVAAWAVIPFASDVEWDGALLRGLLVAVATSVVGILGPHEPFVGIQYKAEVPVPPATAENDFPPNS